MSQRDYYWNEKNSVIIDCENGIERHLCTIKDLTAVPNIRDFGLQDLNDLMDPRHLSTLEKLLPVLNGLLFEKENITRLMGNLDQFKTVLDVFRY